MIQYPLYIAGTWTTLILSDGHKTTQMKQKKIYNTFLPTLNSWFEFGFFSVNIIVTVIIIVHIGILLLVKFVVLFSFVSLCLYFLCLSVSLFVFLSAFLSLSFSLSSIYEKRVFQAPSPPCTIISGSRNIHSSFPVTSTSLTFLPTSFLFLVQWSMWGSCQGSKALFR